MLQENSIEKCAQIHRLNSVSIVCIHKKDPVSLHTANKNMLYEKKDFIGTCKQSDPWRKNLSKFHFIKYLLVL